MSARLLTGAATLALMAGTAQAEYTLHILHTNDMHSRVEPINRFDSTCNAEGRRRRRMLRRHGPARHCRRDEARGAGRCQPAVAGCGRPVPGVAFLHHLQGGGGGRVHGGDRLRRHGRRQPRIRRRAAEAGRVHRRGELPGDLGQSGPVRIGTAEGPGAGPCRAGGRRPADRHCLGAGRGHGGNLEPGAERHLPGRDRQPCRRCAGADGAGCRHHHRAEPCRAAGRSSHRRSGRGDRRDPRRAQPHADAERRRRDAGLPPRW